MLTARLHPQTGLQNVWGDDMFEAPFHQPFTIWPDCIDACSPKHLCKLSIVHCDADDMDEEERQLWTEQILQWMCSPDTSTEIRFACGQALTGGLSCILHLTSGSMLCLQLSSSMPGHLMLLYGNKAYSVHCTFN